MVSRDIQRVLQFDVFPNPSATTRSVRPFVMVLQGNHLEERPTRVVAPLVSSSVVVPTSRMTPTFTIEGKDYVLSIIELSVFPTRSLKGRIAKFDGRRDDVIRALDILFGGV